MKKLALVTLLLGLSAPLLIPAAQAESRYVSDTLHVPLRSGMGNQYRIVHSGMPSGTELELLEEREDSSGEAWSRVRTSNDVEGWVRSQFLLATPTAAMRLSTAEGRVNQLNTQRAQLQGQISELREQNSELSEQLENLQAEHEALQADNEHIRNASASALDLQEQHRELSEAYQMLQTRADVLQADNQRLSQDRRYQEWLFGGGLLIAGILLALILQALGKRKRGSEWG
ncbi:TIGR04211 family SH3 domain-containing protein [Marinimicrobium alkaliphilum]|uniref:TIGR04211 family SH3 domain-containing protein n=1 Tax=Marinimicrobium alkaliphilum TaxID=2202654 RepID=UPI001300827F|nr:TIGR04211 family SH3 domain-containing protein [Marinimicrobium alkaliphilum]